MSGCAVEFIGVYLITSKRNKLGSLALQSDKDELTGLTNEANAFITTPRTSLDEATEDQPTEPLQPTSHPSEIELGAPFGSRRTNAIITHQQPHHYPNSFIPQGLHHHHHHQQHQHQHQQPSDYQSILQDKHRRRSSYIRGLSLASQLVDRTNEESESPLIQLPTPSTSTSSLTSATQPNTNPRSHRRTESKLNHLLSGLSTMAHDVLGGTNSPRLEEHVEEEAAAENNITQSASDQQRHDDVDLMEMGHP